MAGGEEVLKRCAIAQWVGKLLMGRVMRQGLLGVVHSWSSVGSTNAYECESVRMAMCSVGAVGCSVMLFGR